LKNGKKSSNMKHDHCHKKGVDKGGARRKSKKNKNYSGTCKLDQDI